jgi:hypothetical protein
LLWGKKTVRLLPRIEYGGIRNLASASKRLTTVTCTTQIILSLKMFSFVIYHPFLIYLNKRVTYYILHSLHFSYNNCIFNKPTKGTHTIKYTYYYYQHSPICFGAYCAIIRENFIVCLKQLWKYDIFLPENGVIDNNTCVLFYMCILCYSKASHWWRR